MAYYTQLCLDKSLAQKKSLLPGLAEVDEEVRCMSVAVREIERWGGRKSSWHFIDFISIILAYLCSLKSCGLMFHCFGGMILAYRISHLLLLILCN